VKKRSQDPGKKAKVALKEGSSIAEYDWMRSKRRPPLLDVSDLESDIWRIKSTLRS